MPTFSIAIPVRNGERFLATAIGSALAQRRVADEVLVVDDASTDGTQAIATSAKWKGRVRYVYNHKATGFADAFNRVVSLANAEFVVLLSADDVLDDGFLETVEGGLLAYPEVKFCYVAARYIDADGKPMPSRQVLASSRLPRLYDGKVYVHNYLAGCFNHSEIHRCAGIVVEQKLFLQACQFRKEAGIMADNDFFFRIAALTNVIGIAQPLASVRLHSGAISARMESLNLRVSEDYLYQIQFLRNAPEYVAEEDMHFVYALALRSINLLLRESLLRGRPDLCSAALRMTQDVGTVIGPETCRNSIGYTRSLTLYLVYRYSLARRLYKMLVAGASIAKQVKRVTFVKRKKYVTLLEP
jgi:glycosyltransferase involved in cell wall biosynthesis